jgi:ABC-2 type transport system permease protein
VFIDKGCGAEQPFNPQDVLTSDLQQVLFIFPGSLRRREASKLTFERLISTGPSTGTVPADQIVQFSQNLALIENKDSKEYILAARIKGRDAIGDSDADDSQMDAGEQDAGEQAADSGKKDQAPEINVTLVADIDCLYSDFFAIRQRGGDEDGGPNLNLDNVTFVLNVLDDLAGDDRFIEVRKRRQEHRKLTAIEALIAKTKADAADSRQKFIDKFTEEKDKAQRELNQKVADIRNNKDLTPADKIRLERLEEQVGNNRLNQTISRLERDRDREIQRAQREQEREVREIQSRLKMRPVLLAPILPLILGIGVFFVVRGRERQGISQSRMK